MGASCGIQEGRRETLEASHRHVTTNGLRKHRERLFTCHIGAKSASPNIRCRLLTRLACRVPMLVGKTERQRYGLKATVGCWTTPRVVRKIGALIQPVDVISARKCSDQSFEPSRVSKGPKRRAAPLSMSRSCKGMATIRIMVWI